MSEKCPLEKCPLEKCPSEKCGRPMAAAEAEAFLPLNSDLTKVDLCQGRSYLALALGRTLITTVADTSSSLSLNENFKFEFGPQSSFR